MRAGTNLESRSAARGVNTGKVKNIIQLLCPHMEPVKHQFWIHMPTNDDSRDLQVERNPNEGNRDVE